MVDMKAVQEFFFKAMLAGYADAHPTKIKITEMPGYKGIQFFDGDFYLMDAYCVTPDSSKSAGTTTIWNKGIPVWVMQYCGYYEKGVISFLKTALHTTYKDKRFIGGRGPEAYSEKPFLYVNEPRINDFSIFEGCEQVFQGQRRAGYHEYRGMSLI